jgi:class 3 adenylate cyclase
VLTILERKLAAILAADVAGYSRLMELDEAGTFERLRARRTELVEPAIATHRGSIFKLMGDGLLAEFGASSTRSNARSTSNTEWRSRTPGSPMTNASMCASESISAR